MHHSNFVSVVLALVLIGMLTLTFNIQHCESTLPTWECKLDLTASVVSDTEVVLKLFFSSEYLERNWKFRMDIREYGRPPGLGVGVLPEGLELVGGNLVWEGYNNIEQVSIEAKVRAIKDGEWQVDGWAVRVAGTWDSYGALDAVSAEGLTIIVSNGKIIQPLHSLQYILYIGLTALLAVAVATLAYTKHLIRNKKRSESWAIVLVL